MVKDGMPNADLSGRKIALFPFFKYLDFPHRQFDFNMKVA